jgi:hypothetical protein
MKRYYVLVCALLHIFMKIDGNPTISFFFKPFVDVEKTVQDVTDPQNIVHHKVHGILNHVPINGIMVTYGGFITASNYDGEVIVPRKHQRPALLICVTPEMTPIALFENTILHWDLIPGVPAKMYSCDRRYDTKKELFYWDIQEIPLPKNHELPLATMVIVAHPHNVVIKEGKTPTVETANLVLPDIYVKKGINVIKNDTYMISIRHLFKPIDTREHREPFKMLTHTLE